jgi:hypothetical protein
MGCGCAKKKLNGQVVNGASAGRKAVYQVLKDGQVLSEFDTPSEARKAATEAGARVRITSQPISV